MGVLPISITLVNVRVHPNGVARDLHVDRIGRVAVGQQERVQARLAHLFFERGQGCKAARKEHMQRQSSNTKMSHREQARSAIVEPERRATRPESSQCLA